MPDQTVFISYRRETSQYIARAIFAELRLRGYDVFLDVDGLDSGEFSPRILNQIAARAHFLVILTPGSVERCANPNDWLRREIEIAMDLQRNIVPLLVDQFTFAQYADFLTGKLAHLANYNGMNLYHDMFDECINKLINRFLKAPVEVEITPPPIAEQRAVQATLQEAAAEPAPTENELAAEAAVERGYKALLDGNYSISAEEYSKALTFNPKYAPAYFYRGHNYSQMNKIEAATQDWQTTIDLTPEDMFGYLARGSILEAKGQLLAARDLCTDAIRLFPNHFLCYFRRGYVYLLNQNPEAAIADFTYVIRLNPHNAGAYVNRANCYIRLENYHAAIADCDQGIALVPQFAIAYNTRGNAYRGLELYDEALANYNIALEFNPTYDLSYKNRGLTYTLQGNYAAALTDFESYIALDGSQRRGDQNDIEAWIAYVREQLHS